jgi:hypothetical protein
MITCLISLRLDPNPLDFPLTVKREGRRPPLPMRAILPTLTQVEFKCASEYLEDLVARIDAVPLLDCLQITFSKQPNSTRHISASSSVAYQSSSLPGTQ